MTHAKSKIARFVLDNSLLLIAGTAAAVMSATMTLSVHQGVACSGHRRLLTAGAGTVYCL
jgi:hypothetical protein